MLSQRIQHHIADTNQRLNYHSPIYRLLNELLVEIFTFTLAGEHIFEYAEDLVLIRLVSKDWDRVICEAPSLWAQISTNCCDQVNMAAILRSKESPLRVEYNDACFMGEYCNGDRQWDRDRATAFINLASREAFRWQSAEFIPKRDDTLALLRGFVNLSVPQLKKLKIIFDSIEADDGEYAIERVDMFSIGANRLRHIELCNFPFLWTSCLLSRLETLKILGSGIDPGPSVGETLDILRRCPELRIFNLKSRDDHRYPLLGVNSPLEFEAVDLPLLISFTLQLDHPVTFNWIISSLRIPACAEFDLSCWSLSINIFSHKTSHFTTALLSAINSLPDISLTLSADKLKLSRNGGGQIISFSLTGKSPWGNPTWLIDHTAVTWSPSTVQIQCSDNLSFTQTAEFIRGSPSITSLELTGDVDPYIILLIDPTVHNGTYEWVLLNLRELSLKSRADINPQLVEKLKTTRQERVG
ncbi:hypothetical protein FRB93_010423 [Tulasnella sp. JGI-2019a]|nr:hypothetical protein FRB93_010423 [Tulasnella sp. JGI-2019a]